MHQEFLGRVETAFDLEHLDEGVLVDVGLQPTVVEVRGPQAGHVGFDQNLLAAEVLELVHEGLQAAVHDHRGLGIDVDLVFVAGDVLGGCTGRLAEDHVVDLHHGDDPVDVAVGHDDASEQAFHAVPVDLGAQVVDGVTTDQGAVEAEPADVAGDVSGVPLVQLVGEEEVGARVEQH